MTLAARVAPVLAISEADDRLVLAVVRGDDLLARVEGPRTGDLLRDLEAGLEAARGRGVALPRQAVLLTDRATAMCLEVPPIADVAAERVEGLVRYELEPLLPEAGPRGIACGWAAGARGAREPGPLLTCGMPTAERDALAEVCRRRGVRLLGVYARLACAPALAPQDLPPRAAVVELGEDRVAVSRLEQGRVTRLSVARGQGPAAADAALDLVEASEPVLVIGPADDAALATLEAGHDQVRHLPLGAQASLVGAARHALGLPGGERVAGIPGQAPRTPLLQRGAVRAALAACSLAGAVLFADLSLQQRVVALQAEAARARGGASVARAEQSAQQQLARERARLTASVAELRAERVRVAARARRAGELSALLEALARAPEGVALDALEDRPGAVEVSGVALAPGLAEAFLRDVGAALAARGLRLTERRVERGRTASGVEGFRFQAKLVRPAEVETVASASQGGR
ncbi:MAG: hypothetical protein AB7N76_10825 [Planctomycetota bacterium]